MNIETLMGQEGEPNTRCGYVAVIGRPNVGKSTLLNKILGEKLTITSAKPQTTRHQILAIKTDTQAHTQTIFVDTPGLHQDNKRAMNRYLNRAASAVIHDVDVLIFMVSGLQWRQEDEYVLQKLKNVKVPVFLVINKVDTVKDKTRLLPHIQKLSEKFPFAEIIPISARKGTGIDKLEALITAKLPAGPFYFPPEQKTDRGPEFRAAEIVREKLLRLLSQELPYALAVTVEQYVEEEEIIRIEAMIWVERSSQKAIVIGKGGEKLKDIGSQARQDLEKAFNKKVFLRLWTKVKDGWSDDDKTLRSLGYES